MNVAKRARVDADVLFRRGAVALFVLVVSAGVAVKANSYYGNLLRGFDGQFYYAAARSFVISHDWDVTDDLPLSPWQGPFQTQYGVPTREDGGIQNVFPMGLSIVETALLAPAVAIRSSVNSSDAPLGYSALETGIVAAGLIVILALGIQATYSLVRPLTTTMWAVAAVMAEWLGTPRFYYGAWFPFTAHPVTFVVMLMMILVSTKITVGNGNRSLILFGGVAALLYLVRPHETTLTVL